jgi:ABC-type thiamine transport system ATPase subunit
MTLVMAEHLTSGRSLPTNADETALDVQDFSASRSLTGRLKRLPKRLTLGQQDLVAVIIAVLLRGVPVLLYEIPLNLIVLDPIKLLL